MNTEHMASATLEPNETAPLSEAVLPLGVALGDAPLLVFALVPLSWIARFWNAVKLRAESATAFTAKTMPEPQWLAPAGVCCLQ